MGMGAGVHGTTDTYWEWRLGPAIASSFAGDVDQREEASI